MGFFGWRRRKAAVGGACTRLKQVSYPAESRARVLANEYTPLTFTASSTTKPNISRPQVINAISNTNQTQMKPITGYHPN